MDEAIPLQLLPTAIPDRSPPAVAAASAALAALLAPSRTAKRRAAALASTWWDPHRAKVPLSAIEMARLDALQHLVGEPLGPQEAGPTSSFAAAPRRGPQPVLRSARALAVRQSSWALLGHERLAALGLDGGGRVVSEVVVSGGRQQVVASPRQLLGPAVAGGAVSVALAHNHPSGSVHPSRDDIAFTARIDEACRLLGMHLRWHVIVASGGWAEVPFGRPWVPS